MTDIRICGQCKTPLIWTFLWAYNERYCLNCGRPTPMFDGSSTLKLSTELRAQNRVIQDVWKALRTNLLPRSRYTRDKCVKCNTEGNHSLHLTKREIARDKYATQILEKLGEGFVE